MKKILVRLADKHDYAAQRAINNNCWATFYPAYIGRAKVKKVLEGRKKRPFKFKKNSKKLFRMVAVFEKKIAGFSYCTIRKKHVHLQALYIEPSLVNKGIGSALMKGLFKEFKKRKMQKALLEVIVKNKKAQNFYKKFGFQITGEKWFRLRGSKIRVFKMERKL